MTFKRTLAAVGVAGALTAGLTLAAAGTANALEQTNCILRTDFLTITTRKVLPVGTDVRAHCWANAGGASVNYSGVIRLSAGDNKGRIETNDGRIWFEKWERKNFETGPKTISFIRIH